MESKGGGLLHTARAAAPANNTVRWEKKEKQDLEFGNSLCLNSFWKKEAFGRKTKTITVKPVTTTMMITTLSVTTAYVLLY